MRARYAVEVRDSRERWHRPRLPRFQSAAFAIRRGADLVAHTYTRATAFRVVNVETGEEEYREVV